MSASRILRASATPLARVASVLVSIVVTAAVWTCGTESKVGGPEGPSGPSPAVGLAFTTQPHNTTAGVVLAPAIQVTVLDSAGGAAEAFTEPVSVLIGINAGSGTLSGTTTVTPVKGVATFSSLSIDKAGRGYRLIAFATRLSGVYSDSFAITAGAPKQVGFTVQPTTTAARHTITPPVQVAIQDSLGNTVTAAASGITVSILTNAGGGTLGGTTTAGAVSGVATFASLRIDMPGSGYTLAASSSGLNAATSAAFNINPVFIAVSAGELHTCGLRTRGIAYCWGRNDEGELGNGSTTSSSVPIAVSGSGSFASLSAGSVHSCGLVPGGAASCWGFNHDGELGNGSTVNSGVPVSVSGGLTFGLVTVGYGDACAVTTSGAAYCWGNNTSGQLGNGSTTASSVPVAVSGGLVFASVSAGLDHVCGVTTAGAAYCWGNNAYGSLGNGSVTSSTVPVAVSGALPFASVGAGFRFACGLTTAGGAYCWGDNYDGELGIGSTTGPQQCSGPPCSMTPVEVSGSLSFTSLSVGYTHTCGLTGSGAAYCWGFNGDGELGNGSTTNSAVPVAVTGGLTFVSVSAGYGHTCAVATSGTAYCWGYGIYGQLGNGGTANSTTPTPVTNP
jgi:alpha-tubulin suppressor-like RCC1 family protein